MAFGDVMELGDGDAIKDEYEGGVDLSPLVDVNSLVDISKTLVSAWQNVSRRGRILWSNFAFFSFISIGAGTLVWSYANIVT